MKVSDEIIKVLDILAQRVGVVIDWTTSNVLPYIEQLFGKYVNYEIVTSIVWIVFAIILSILCVFLFRLLNKNKKWGVTEQFGVNSYEGRVASYIGVIVLCLIPVFIILAQTFDIIACLTLPEKVIIDEIQHLIEYH